MNLPVPSALGRNVPRGSTDKCIPVVAQLPCPVLGQSPDEPAPQRAPTPCSEREQGSCPGTHRRTAHALDGLHKRHESAEREGCLRTAARDKCGLIEARSDLDGGLVELRHVALRVGALTF